MNRGKMKIEQYGVRGKHRGFYVLRFPELEYTWAYYGEWIDGFSSRPIGWYLPKNTVQETLKNS